MVSGFAIVRFAALCVFVEAAAIIMALELHRIIDEYLGEIRED